MHIKEEQQTQKKLQHKKLWQKKQYVFIGLLCVFLSGSIATNVGYLIFDMRYHRDLSLAQTGLQHMQ